MTKARVVYKALLVTVMMIVITVELIMTMMMMDHNMKTYVFSLFMISYFYCYIVLFFLLYEVKVQDVYCYSEISMFLEALLMLLLLMIK